MFKEDSLLQRFFYQWGQLIALNLLWIATSLLLVTIGASTTALYHCCLKWQKDKDVAVLRTYWKAFRENFSQATLGWLSLSAITLLLWLEQRFLRSMSGTAALVFGYAQWMVVLSLLILTTYLFPVIAAFRNRLSTLLGHSFYFFFKRPHIGLVNLLLIILPIWVTLNDRAFFGIYLFIWLLCGFSGLAYLQSCLYWRLFRPHLGGSPKTVSTVHEPDQYVF
ncbi:MAG: DUF624 domain-containing protein [Lachnospiraceae bacterium]|nr:DUF624 domain-containing protein [Lachnospiraceae bacterium]MDY5742070.1 DUF624 domain-containing protein [Lachnospiraceae bacterium]